MFRPPKSRYERHVARRRFEELTAWIVLPIVVLIGWWIIAQIYGAWDVPTAALLPNR